MGNFLWKTPPEFGPCYFMLPLFGSGNMVLLTMTICIDLFYLLSCNIYKEMEKVCYKVNIPQSMLLVNLIKIIVLP